MDRYAIFVDAGYFFAAGSNAAFGGRVPRKQVSLKSPPVMLAALCDKASIASGNLPFLRTYWYDAMPGFRPSLEQSSLAMLSGVKVRFGALNSMGEQKGVDSLIVTDIIDLARNRAIADAVIVTGDEDLRIAVQVAQSFGVRVHILAAGDPSTNVSPTLQMEADSVSSLDRDWFLKHLDLVTTTTAQTISAPATAQIQNVTIADGSAVQDIASATLTVIGILLSETTPEQLERLASHFSSQTTVPPEFDRPLVARVSAGLSGRRLSGDEMRQIRGMFVRAVKSQKN